MSLNPPPLPHLADLIFEAVLCLDQAYRVVYVNPAAERMFGYGREELLGGPVDLLIPDAVRAAHADWMKGFAAGPNTARLMEGRPEVLGRRRDGRLFPAEASITKMDIDGEPLLTVVLRDTSERRCLEEALRRSEERYRQMMMFASDAIFISDGHGRFTEVNQRACELLGYTPRELIGKEVSSVVPAESQVLVEETMQRLRGGGQEFGEWRMRRSDGSVVEVEVSARVLPDGFGMALVRDISERKRMERALQRLYEDAQRAIAVREHVLRVVAHDLRNPLSGIHLTAGLLRMELEAPTERQEEQLTGIKRCVQRADRLIGDLLDAAQVSAGTMRVHMTAYPVAQLVEEALALHRVLFDEHQLTAQVDLAADLPAVLADRERVAQVLSNLLGNALKFTPAGGTITVRARPQEGRVCFSVSDSGPGIPLEQQAHLFAPFWQAHPEERHGAGLGLAIARGLIEAQGGAIWVESTPGGGATFCFTLKTAP